MNRTFRMESISIELIVSLNVNNYIDWLFNLDWKKPTENDKLDFIFRRKDRFDTQMFWFESEKKGSPLPDKIIADREGERICEHINSNPQYLHLLFKLLNGQVIDDYVRMAELIGNIDYLQFLYNIKNDIKKAPDSSAEPTPEPLPTVAEKLKINFKKYGFYELKMIKDLKENSVEKLILKISENNLPFKIAMIHFLGVIEHLEAQHFKTKNKMYSEIGNWFDSTAREIGGNIRVLNPVSKEDRQRYTADQYMVKVTKDYNKLK